MRILRGVANVFLGPSAAKRLIRSSNALSLMVRIISVPVWSLKTYSFGFGDNILLETLSPLSVADMVLRVCIVNIDTVFLDISYWTSH